MSLHELYQEASFKTADDLRTIARSPQLQDLSSLSLPEIDEIVDLVSRMVPAGNVPGVILNGLTRLAGRKLPFDSVKRDINLLFRGVEQTVDTAVYGAFFAGPAAVIWGYQNLLRLVGKSPDDAFPEGTWQFYVDYALREDTARHTNETHGFDTALRQHGLALNPVDRATAWVMTAIHALHQYHDLLASEWRERVYTHLLSQTIREHRQAAGDAPLYRDWVQQLPYKRGQGADPAETYSAYRRRTFDQFIAAALSDLPANARRKWEAQVLAAEATELPAYQRQMSILAYLDPGPYGEVRVPFGLAQAHVGLIYRGNYYLLPACVSKTTRPTAVETVRGQITALMATPSEATPTSLTPLLALKRTALAKLRRDVLDKAATKNLDLLRLAPILLNLDQRPPTLPLAEIRQTERGAGDHALTVFDTGATFLFDQSHIFFDGGWGAALAEILTNEALSWAVYLSAMPPPQSEGTPLAPLSYPLNRAALDYIRRAPQITAEVSAETEAVNLKAMLALRQIFKQRSDLLQLTVNDILVLYRAIHAATYQPAPGLVRQLQNLTQQSATQEAATAALIAIDETKQINPAIVIPVDVSSQSPSDRLAPLTFEVPLEELDLLNLLKQVITALDAYKKGQGNTTKLYANFDRLQRVCLATLAGFGTVMSKAKEIALLGESASVGTIRLLAHMPAPLQRMLDKVPGRFDLLNDLIKGREVFSNLGPVAPKSTLTRFITAKDDNDKKSLAWGVMTDATGVLHLSLRDFRPHVGLLIACNHKTLATQITQDYLDAYTNGLNQFIYDLRRITMTSRETSLWKPE